MQKRRFFNSLESQKSKRQYDSKRRMKIKRAAKASQLRKFIRSGTNDELASRDVFVFDLAASLERIKK